VNKRLRIFFVTNLYPSTKEPYKGSFVRNIFVGFADLGVDVKLIKLEYISTLMLFRLFSFMIFHVKAFFAALFSKKSDVFYIHYVSHSSLGVLLASFFRKLNIVSNVHGTDVLPEISHGIYTSFFNVTLSRLILFRSSMIISPSEYFKGVIIDKYKVDDALIYISPSGGVNSSIFYPLVRNKGLDEVVNFGYIGRIEKAKGVDDLLMAYIDLLKTNKNVSLTIIGSGYGYDKAKSVSNKIKSIEILPGLSQEMLSEKYSTFDYLVFPSHHESLGLVPIEAMMCGIPVIASRIGAVSGYIKDELTSLSFEPGNTIELLESMKKAITVNDCDYDNLCELSVEISKDFKSEKVIPNLYDLFFNEFVTKKGRGNN
jgi:glycosyltransferase involved in cell wall biosynthesis